MEIHPSSLRTPPVGLNRFRTDKASAADNNVEQDDLKLSNKPNKKSADAPTIVQTTADIEKTLAREDVQIIPEPTGVIEQFNKPFNKRTQQALTAYTNQINQPKINQRTDLIVGIDFFV